MNIRPRSDYSMPGPLGPPMNLPASTFYVHHSVTQTANGPAAVRTVAQIGVTRFDRASYSYAVTLDGTCWEMQADRIGAHTLGQNSVSLGVCLVGNYDVVPPSGPMLDTVARLYGHLVDRGHLKADALVRGHRDAPGAVTACPGRHAYAQLPVVRARIVELTTAPPEEEDRMAGAIAMQVQGQATVWVGDPGPGEAFRVRNPAELRKLAELGYIPRDTLGQPVVWQVSHESSLDYYFPFRDRRSRVSVEGIAREVAERVQLQVPDGATADEIIDRLAERLIANA